MPSFVIHIAVANEYLRKHNKKESKEEFIKGNLEPDLANNKKSAHYCERISYIYLDKFLEENKIEDSFDRGYFLHLVTDYLFYNKYLDYYVKDKLYNDYYILNKEIIEKYNVELIDKIKEFMILKEGKLEVLNIDMIHRLIEEASSLDLDVVAKEIKNNNEKWNKFKNII